MFCKEVNRYGELYDFKDNGQSPAAKKSKTSKHPLMSKID